MHACYHACMQLTLRVPDELAVALKARATERDESVNRYASAVLAAAVDPELAGSAAEVLRERLGRAGLLAQGPPSRAPRPTEAELDSARAAAGRGTPLAKLVGEARR